MLPTHYKEQVLTKAETLLNNFKQTYQVGIELFDMIKFNISDKVNNKDKYKAHTPGHLFLMRKHDKINKTKHSWFLAYQYTLYNAALIFVPVKIK